MNTKMKKPATRTKRTSRLKLTTVLVATVVLAIAAITVVSRQRAGAAGTRAADQSLAATEKSNYTKVKVAGQDVEVDPQTGKIRPLTREEAQKLAAGLKDMLNQSTEGLEQVQHEDGSVSMDLKGRFQNVTVARVNQDGSVTQSCVDNPQAAGAFFGIDPKLIEKPNTTPAADQPNPQPVERKQ